MATDIKDATLQTEIDVSDLTWESDAAFAQRFVGDLTWDDYDALMLGSSATLDRSSKKNWVENAGELPPYVREVARSIEKTGKSLSNAIQIAIGKIKTWARGGDDVSAETQAKASKAVAQWEALKAKNKAKKSSGNHSVQVQGGGTEVDPGALALALGDHRELRGMPRGGLDLAVTTFNPSKHPRDFRGRFREVVGGLKEGERVDLPDGITVTKSKSGGFTVSKHGGTNKHFKAHKLDNAEAAADAALDHSAKGTTNPNAVGGARKWPSAKAFEDDNKRTESVDKDFAKTEARAKARKGAPSQTKVKDRKSGTPSPDREGRSDGLNEDEDAKVGGGAEIPAGVPKLKPTASKSEVEKAIKAAGGSIEWNEDGNGIVTIGDARASLVRKARRQSWRDSGKPEPHAWEISSAISDSPGIEYDTLDKALKAIAEEW